MAGNANSKRSRMKGHVVKEFYAFGNERKVDPRSSKTWYTMLGCALVENHAFVDLTARIISPMLLYTFSIIGFKTRPRGSTLSSYSNFL